MPKENIGDITVRSGVGLTRSGRSNEDGVLQSKWLSHRSDFVRHLSKHGRVSGIYRPLARRRAAPCTRNRDCSTFEEFFVSFVYCCTACTLSTFNSQTLAIPHIPMLLDSTARRHRSYRHEASRLADFQHARSTQSSLLIEGQHMHDIELRRGVDSRTLQCLGRSTASPP